MSDRLQREEIEPRCERLQYPIMRADAAAEFESVTVEIEDSEENLGVVISELDNDRFTSPDELYEAVSAVLRGDSSLRGV